jgi:hypothetical protein
VRVPGGIKSGVAKVTVSIPGWSGIALANPTLEIKVED